MLGGRLPLRVKVIDLRVGDRETPSDRQEMVPAIAAMRTISEAVLSMSHNVILFRFSGLVRIECPWVALEPAQVAAVNIPHHMLDRTVILIESRVLREVGRQLDDFHELLGCISPVHVANGLIVYELDGIAISGSGNAPEILRRDPRIRLARNGQRGDFLQKLPLARAGQMTIPAESTLRIG